MKRNLTPLNMIVLALFYVSTPVFAQNAELSNSSTPLKNADKVENLQQIIEEQQKQLDAQQKQLNGQREQLQLLRQQLQELAESPTPTKQSAEKQSSEASSAGEFSRRRDSQTRRRDRAQSLEDWEGSFKVDGSNTRFKIGGFVRFDAIHDNDAITTPGLFETAAIVTRDPTKAEGADGQTSFSVSPSRLFIESRTPIKDHRLTTYISMDLFGDSSTTTPEPRLRQAYGEVTNLLFGGDLLAGQIWSTVSDLEAVPDTLDFEGPQSRFGDRLPIVRWTRSLSKSLKLAIAAESPNKHIIQGADSLTAWPDGVIALAWDSVPIHLMGSLIARDLRASFNDGPTDSAFGWGGSISGKVGTPFIAEKDFMTFSATYGEGVGSGFFDAPPDAVFDRTSTRLEAIPVFGYFASFEHWWSWQFRSALVYGAIKANNRSSQPPNSYKKTQYASANFIWEPTKRWLIGVEGLWGKREDKDGADGSVFRALFSTQFNF
jgi:hypothetical protein